MRRRIGLLCAALATALATMTALVTAATPASAATLTEVTDFGTNPSNLRMHLYVPDRVAARPAILVAVHYCTGSGPAFYSGTEFASLADQYGFIVIYPSATRSGAAASTSPRRRRCATTAAATRSASCRWSTTCGSATTATRTGSTSPASPPAP